MSVASTPSGNEADLGAIGLAVPGEAVAAEREGECGEPCILRCIGEAIDARRQEAGQGARSEQVARFCTLVLEPEQHLRDRAIGRGQREIAARFCGEGARGGELALRRR